MTAAAVVHVGPPPPLPSSVVNIAARRAVEFCDRPRGTRIFAHASDGTVGGLAEGRYERADGETDA